MITDVASERLIVISDLHLGNPFCRSKRQLIDFLEWASHDGWDLCVNGDGLEIAQASFTKLAQDVPDVLHALKKFSARGRKTYYVIGNHDIALEHFLNDWGSLKLAPFLNLNSGERRIRIEHGHLYDPFFVRHPRLYEFLTWVAGFFLQVSPNFYRLWMRFETLLHGLPSKEASPIKGEDPSFVKAAQRLCARGFDGVIFGHTHRPGHAELEDGNRYFNSGSWLVGSSYVEIDRGRMTLKRWDKKSPLPE